MKNYYIKNRADNIMSPIIMGINLYGQIIVASRIKNVFAFKDYLTMIHYLCEFSSWRFRASLRNIVIYVVLVIIKRIFYGHLSRFVLMQ